MSNIIPTKLRMTGKEGFKIAPEEKLISGNVIGRFCGALRSRVQDIMSNYMALQAQVGFYGSTDEYGDP